MNKVDPIKIIRQIIGNDSSYTILEVEQAVDSYMLMQLNEDDDRELLIRRVEELYKIRQDDYKIITREERYRPWLLDKKSHIDFENGFWGRYRDHLADEKNFPPDTINKLDVLTDRILDSLFDPNESYVQTNKKGLVVGQVQSGKTANYTGLICKAADAGFGLIIIMAGIHNNLRSQTQLRIDEGFLGFDTQHVRALDQNMLQIGVGNTEIGKVAHSLTSSLEKGDFTQGAANAIGLSFETKDPIIAVIKKNPHVLRRIHGWLAAQSGPDNKIRNKSVLIIDDEADNASINISNDPEVNSTINRGITQILSLFGRNAYVGYTATPFANIFIPLNDENLFPRDFIINIPAPSSYIGPHKIFGFDVAEEDDETLSVLPIVNRIEDYPDFVPNRHKKDDQVPSSLPDSLKNAIRCFILTCAIRRLRGQKTVHNSMLVHVSRFVRWQDHITELVSIQFHNYRRGIDQNDDQTMELLRQTFEKDLKGYSSYKTVSAKILKSDLKELDSQIQVHTWEEVNVHLHDAASKIEVKAIHGGSGEALDYYEHKNGLSVIAIGGNKLSRGLTLEGLSVSYYLRASRMYDTLMQMGRWFGYRSGYVDLCRLFTSRELNEWFCHITRASEELRQEFDYMSDVAGATPEQYALKVRTHPGVLQISASNKMRSATNVQISWAGRLVESYEFKKDITQIQSNLKHTKRFVQSLTQNFKAIDKGFIWENISCGSIVQFFSGIKALDNLKAYDPQNLIRFISKQDENGELTNWRVILMSKSSTVNTTTISINDNSEEIGHWKRTADDKILDDSVYYLRKSHIISPGDEFLDLTKDQYAKAMDLTKSKRKKEGVPKYPNGQIVRNEIRDPKEPLLILYLLDPQEGATGMPIGTEPFVGYAISFPKSDFNAPVTYAIHEELIPQFDMVEEEIEDYGVED